MAWQDELIELETKLASGALSAEEYRRARDELFAQSQTSSAADAAAQQPPAQQEPAAEPPQQAPTQQPTPQQPAVQATQAAPQPPPQPSPGPAQAPPGQPAPGQQGPGGPFPPPFQWGQPGTEAPDSTQIIRPIADEQPERTQVVRDDPERTQTVAGAQLADPERTQAVSGIGTRQPQQSQQPNQGWTDDDAPPWASSDSAPVIAPNTTWTRQGPESFDSGSGGGNRGRLVGTVVASVLVLALVVVAVIYFTTAGGGNDQAGTPTGQAPLAGGGPQSTSSAPPPLEDPPPAKPEPKSDSRALAKVPGQLRPGSGPISRSEMKRATFFAPSAVTAINDGGFTRGLLKATIENGNNIGVFALSLRDAQAATQVAQAYGSVQEDGGIPERREDSLRGVLVYGTPDDSSDETTVRRAVYVLYDRVVIIDVGGSERSEVTKTFEKVLDKQVEFAPPTERDGLS